MGVHRIIMGEHKAQCNSMEYCLMNSAWQEFREKTDYRGTKIRQENCANHGPC